MSSQTLPKFLLQTPKDANMSVEEYLQKAFSHACKSVKKDAEHQIKQFEQEAAAVREEISQLETEVLAHS